MPQVLIDITRLVRRQMAGRLPTGVDRVALEYLRHFSGRACGVLSKGGQSAVLSQPDSARAFASLLEQRVDRMAARRVIGKAVLGAWRVPDLNGKVLLNVGHSGLHHPRYASRLRSAGARMVFFVHDLIPLTHSEYCRAGERERHIARMRNALSMSNGVIANSIDTLETLERESIAAGWRRLPAAVAPLAPAITAVAPGPRPVAAPYFVVLGTIEPRKNHWMLLQIWRRLVEERGEAAPRLVVIGQRGWECENVVDFLERSAHLRRHVIERPACSDAELANYLHHSQALLFPTFAEGYGLPLVEALSLGVPAIASDLRVFHEVVGDVPEYASPLDGAQWKALITDYARAGSARRDAQLARIACVALPTWKDHFRVVDDFLEHGIRDDERPRQPRKEEKQLALDSAEARL